MTDERREGPVQAHLAAMRLLAVPVDIRRVDVSFELLVLVHCD